MDANYVKEIFDHGQTEKRFAMPLVPLALIFFASFLVAQRTPNACANVCLVQYTSAVKACPGNATCLAAAREAAKTCIEGCTR